MMSDPIRSPQRVAITGSSGLLGSALSQALRERGDEVIHLVRRDPRHDVPDGVTEAAWDPATGLSDPHALDEATAAVNLGGAGLGDRRWTRRYKTELIESRVTTTNTLSGILSRLPQRPRLLSGSAIGIYGNRGDLRLTEASTLGSDFVADLARDWEHATWLAQDAGCAVAHLRSGIVLSRSGGALARLLPVIRWGIGGPMGGGQQFWSWISLPDHVAAMLFLLDHPEISGPVNLTAPEPERQQEVVKALAAMMHRPSLAPAPTIAIRLAVGEMAVEVLGSRRVIPTVLQDNGFEFTHPHLADAAAWVTEQRTA